MFQLIYKTQNKNAFNINPTMETFIMKFFVE